MLTVFPLAPFLAIRTSLLAPLRTNPPTLHADVNNEYPANAGAGADVKTDSESKKFSNEGSSGAMTADL